MNNRCPSFVGARQIGGSWHKGHTCNRPIVRDGHCGTHANMLDREAAERAAAAGGSWTVHSLNATVTAVESVRGNTCQDCGWRTVTREVHGGTYGDGSDDWEAFLCAPCLRERANEQHRQDEKLARLMDEREAAEQVEEAAHYAREVAEAALVPVWTDAYGWDKVPDAGAAVNARLDRLAEEIKALKR